MSDSLLPFNATPLERAIEATLKKRSDALPLLIARIWDPQHCPEILLPWLAWALSVDTWDSHWPIEIKRQAIAHSVLIHRAKGTVAAIERVLATLGIHAELSEWFEFNGPPHTFRLTAWVHDNSLNNASSLFTSTLYRQINNAVDNVKPVRSHYDLRVGAAFSVALGMAGQFSVYAMARATMKPKAIIGFTPTTLIINATLMSVSAVRVEMETT